MIIRRCYSTSSNHHSVSSNQARSNATQEVGNTPRRHNTSRRAPTSLTISRTIPKIKVIPLLSFGTQLSDEPFRTRVFGLATALGKLPLYFIIVVRLALDNYCRTIARKSKWLPLIIVRSRVTRRTNARKLFGATPTCKPNIFTKLGNVPHNFSGNCPAIKLGNVPHNFSGNCPAIKLGNVPHKNFPGFAPLMLGNVPRYIIYCLGTCPTYVWERIKINPTHAWERIPHDQIQLGNVPLTIK